MFECAWDARRGAQQLYDLFTRIEMPRQLFQHRAFTRLKQLEYLIHTRQIDDNFFWNGPTTINTMCYDGKGEKFLFGKIF